MRYNIPYPAQTRIEYMPNPYIAALPSPEKPNNFVMDKIEKQTVDGSISLKRSVDITECYLIGNASNPLNDP